MITLFPAPREAGAPYRIAVVCLGNICRSPIADVVLAQRIADAGLAERVQVASAGTGNWHVGNPMDARATAVLSAHGYDASRHRAQLFGSHWFHDCDLILAMDGQNLADVLSLAQSPDERERVRMFRDFDPEVESTLLDVPDPYYGGHDGFEQVLAIIERTSEALVSSLVPFLDLVGLEDEDEAAAGSEAEPPQAG